MYTLYSAIAAMIFTMFVPRIVGVSILWTIIPSFIVAIIVFILIKNHFKAKVESLMGEAMKEMEQIQAIAARGQRTQAVVMTIDKKRAKAVELMKSCLAFQNWQMGLALQINAQVGMILFSQYAFLPKKEKSKLNEVLPYLEGTLVKGVSAKLFQSLWYSWVCLASCYVHLNKSPERTLEILEDAVKIAEKEGFLWSFYGWVLHQAGEKQKAIDVLARGVNHSEDPLLKANLNALKNQKGMRMSDYGQSWYGLGFELPKHLMGAPQQMGHPRMKAGRGRR